MSKTIKNAEVSDETLDKVVGGKPDWINNDRGNMGLKSNFSKTNLNVNQKSNFLTRLLSIFGLNKNTNLFGRTNQNSITNQFENMNMDVNANINANINNNINQNQNEN